MLPTETRRGLPRVLLHQWCRCQPDPQGNWNLTWSVMWSAWLLKQTEGTPTSPTREGLELASLGVCRESSCFEWCHWASQVALVVKNLPANAGDISDVGSIPGSGRNFGVGHGNPLQHSCLENPMDRGAWRATVHRVSKSQTRLEQSVYFWLKFPAYLNSG